MKLSSASLPSMYFRAFLRLFTRLGAWSPLAVVAALILGAVSSTQAASLYSVTPLTNKILLVYIEDGHVKYHGAGESLAQNVVYHSPVDLGRALSGGNYTVQSSDDANYGSARGGVYVGRKSKGIYFNDPFDTSKPKYVFGHRLYVELPQALTAGKTYTVKLNNLTENRGEVTFVYDVAKVRSEAVHVNQIGFAPSSVKYAYISQWMGDYNNGPHNAGGLNLDDRAGTQFRIVNRGTGATAFTGTITKRMAKTFQETLSGDYGPEQNYTHADVWEANFSSLTTPGEYVVAVDGMGSSYPFEIGNDVHRETMYYSLKGLFGQRQGIVREYEGGAKIYPRDHHPDDLVWRYDANWEGGEANDANPGSPRVYGIWGYYHDAGDWDAYIRHSLAPLHLYLLFDLAPEKFRDGDVGNRYKLKDTDANWIDEGSNGIPDVLDEASWLTQYFKRAKAALISQGFGSGGVPGYVGRDAIVGNNIGSWQDNGREWYVSRENVYNTYYFAAQAAWFAATLNKFYQIANPGQNHPDAAGWVAEARAAWNWSNSRNAGVSGPRRVAAAALFRVTSETTFQDAFKAGFEGDPNKSDGEWGTPNDTDFAISIYAMLPANHPNLDVAYQNQIKTFLINKADTVKLDNIGKNGFRSGLELYQTFILGGIATPRQTLLPVAHKLTGDVKYLNGLQNATSYTLGGNQLNKVYISGLGDNPDNEVFHPSGWYVYRANHPAYDDEQLPGIVTYFGSQSYWFYQSIFSEFESRGASHPAAQPWPNAWPESESKFDNRFSIQGGEFTLDQNLGVSAYAYGYLNASSQTGTAKYVVNARPTVSLNLTENQNFSSAGASLTVNASSDTRLVRYFYEWQVIGESTDIGSNFQVFWVPPLNQGTKVLVTAIAYDDKGKISLPSDAGDKNVTIAAGANVAVTGVTLNRTTLTVDNGGSGTLTATVTPTDASNKSVAWTSLNPTIATVSGSGLVQGASLGTATIRATTVDGGFTAQATVTVVAPTPPSGVPSALTATAASASQINLAWVDGTTNESAFKVEQALAEAGPWTEISTTVASDSTAYSASGLTSATTYYFRVRASNGGGNSAYTNVVSATTLTGPSPTVNIVGTATAPTIDGTADAIWSSAAAAQPITFATGSVTDATDLSGGWRALWDATNLYVVVDVTDDTKQNDSTNAWDDDSVEIYIDGSNNKTGAYDANDRQYVFGYGDTAVVEGGGRNAAGITFAKADPTATTYRLEVKIPWSAIGVTPAAGSAIGIDVQINDDDNGTTRDGKLAWKDGTDQSWSNPSLFGTGNLQPVSTTNVPVTGITVAPTTASIAVNGTTTLTATVLPANATNKAATWSTSNAAIATISPAGVVTGVSAGTATITATTTEGGFTASSTITVTALPVAVTGITVAPTSATIPVNGTTTLTATVLPANASNKAATWSTSNAAIATVTSAGVVTGVSAGTATITATTAQGGFTAASTITVTTVTVPVTGITVAPTSATIAVTGTTTLTATVLPASASNKAASWSTSNAAVATVTSGGVVTGVSAGTATITATTAEGGFTASSTITVQSSGTIAVNGVTVAPTSIITGIGGTTTLTPSLIPANATNKTVSWTTNNATVATVSAAGVVTGNAIGVATITVATQDGGFTATSVVTVTDAPDNTIRFEAEDGIGSAGTFVFLDESASNGEGRGDFINAGDSVEWAGVPSSTRITISYFSPNGNTLALLVNGTKVATVVLASTQDWATKTVDVAIPAGATLKLLKETTNTSWSDLDFVDFLGNPALNVVAARTPSAINVNGALSESVWSITNPAAETASGANNNTVTFGVLWDNIYLYVGVKVVDSTIRTNRANIWENDSVEVHIDGNFNKGASYDATDVRIIKQANVRTIWTSRSVAGIQHGRASISGGYTVEIGIPWAAIGGLPAAGAKIGFDVLVNDNDLGNGAAGRLIWNGDLGNTSSTVNFGELTVGTGSVGTLVPASGVTVSPTSATVAVYGTTSVSATVLPTNATNRVATWSSSNPAVATVSASGLVTGVSAGSASIIATTQDGGYTASVALTVTAPAPQTVPVTGVTVSPATASIAVQATTTLTATIAPANATNKSATWSTSNAAIATVSASGVVTGVSAGNATITATTQDGNKTGSATITVTPAAPVVIPVTGVTVAPATVSIAVQATATLTATIAPADATNKSATWSTSNASVATVSAAGVVTGVSAGTATITATTQDGSKTGSSAVTVTAVTPPPPSVPEGTALKVLSGVVVDGDIAETVWSLPNTASETVSGTPNNTVTFGALWDADNLYVAVKVLDTALNTAGANPWDNDSVEVHIDGNFNKGTTYDSADVQIIQQYNAATPWSSRTLTGLVGKTKGITGGYTVELSIPWSTIGGLPAAGSKIGFDIGLNDNDAGMGRTSQTIWKGDGNNWGNTANFGELTLSAQTVGTPIAVTGIAVTPATASLAVTDTQILAVAFTPVNASNRTVAWTSSDATVATVSGAGVVTGVKVGTATITVTTQDGSKTATTAVTVTAAPPTPPVSTTPRTGLLGTNFWSADSDVDASGAITAGNNGYGFQIWKTGTKFAENPTDPWNPVFMAELNPYSTIRFMDWNNINWGPNQYWNKRTQKWHQRQSSDPGIQWSPASLTQQDGTRTYGVAYEWMIDLCNRKNANMWMNVPYLAIAVNDFPNGNDFNNDYMHKLAILLRFGVDMKEVNLKTVTGNDLSKLQNYTRQQLVAAGGVATSTGLNPNLKLYIEASNEPWLRENHNYAVAEGRKLGVNDGGYFSQYEWVSWALPRLWKAFADVYGRDNPQVVRFLHGVFWWDAHIERVMTRMNQLYNPWNLQPTHYSWATYVGGAGTANQLGQFRGDLATQSAAWAKAKDFVGSKWGLRLLSYEGGQHFDMGNGQVAFGDNPESYTAYREWIGEVSKYFDVVCHYTHSGFVQDWDQAWGAMKYQGQPLSQAHKYRALLDWQAANPGK